MTKPPLSLSHRRLAHEERLLAKQNRKGKNEVDKCPYTVEVAKLAGDEETKSAKRQNIWEESKRKDRQEREKDQVFFTVTPYDIPN